MKDKNIENTLTHRSFFENMDDSNKLLPTKERPTKEKMKILQVTKFK